MRDPASDVRVAGRCGGWKAEGLSGKVEHMDVLDPATRIHQTSIECQDEMATDDYITKENQLTTTSLLQFREGRWVASENTDSVTKHFRLGATMLVHSSYNTTGLISLCPCIIPSCFPKTDGSCNMRETDEKMVR